MSIVAENKKWSGLPSLALGGSEAQHLSLKGKAALVQTKKGVPYGATAKILCYSQREY